MDPIYIAQGGQQFRPYSREQVEEMIRTGSVSLNDQAWHQGLPSWVPLQQILSPAIPTLSIPLPSSPVAQAATTTGAQAQFLYIPMARLVAMSILSLGFYESYWIYKNWRYLKERDGYDMRPFWRGIFGVFWIQPLLTTIRNDPQTTRVVKPTFDPTLLAGGWILLVVAGNVLSRSSHETLSLIGFLVSIPSFCFLIPVQRHINALNQAGSQRPAFARWSAGHIVCLVLGLIFWALVLVGIFMADEPAG